MRSSAEHFYPADKEWLRGCSYWRLAFARAGDEGGVGAGAGAKRRAHVSEQPILAPAPGGAARQHRRARHHMTTWPQGRTCAGRAASYSRRACHLVIRLNCLCDTSSALTIEGAWRCNLYTVLCHSRWSACAQEERRMAVTATDSMAAQPSAVALVRRAVHATGSGSWRPGCMRGLLFYG